MSSPHPTEREESVDERMHGYLSELNRTIREFPETLDGYNSDKFCLFFGNRAFPYDTMDDAVEASKNRFKRMVMVLRKPTGTFHIM